MTDGRHLVTKLTIEELGKEGEDQARLILKDKGFNLTSPDWLAEKDGKWFQFEIKRKERFEPPPFEGHGLNINQIDRRIDLYKKTGMRPYLMIWEIKSDIWYGQWLDILESKESFVTKNNIKIYKLSNYGVLKI